MTRRVFLPAGLLAVFCAWGCGKKPPPIVAVEGRVTVAGKPLPKAEVRFYPVTSFGGEYIAAGETDDEGRYKLTCVGKPGACACENRVTVTEAPLPAELRGMSGQAQEAASRFRAGLKNRPIPPQYANLAQSDATIEVKQGQKEYKLDLKR